MRVVGWSPSLMNLEAPPERIALARSLAESMDLPFIDLDAALAREDVDIVSLCTEVERRGNV